MHVFSMPRTEDAIECDVQTTGLPSNWHCESHSLLKRGRGLISNCHCESHCVFSDLNRSVPSRLFYFLRCLRSMTSHCLHVSEESGRHGIDLVLHTVEIDLLQHCSAFVLIVLHRLCHNLLLIPFRAAGLTDKPFIRRILEKLFGAISP